MPEHHQPIRRQLLAAPLVAALAARGAAAVSKTNPVILLRSSWQTVNIGDIAHTPGVLRILSTRWPAAKLILWASNVDRGVQPMLEAAFPGLSIVKGRCDESGKASNEELAAALEAADLLVHGSGPSVVAGKDVESWRKRCDKPYAIFGCTIERPEPIADLLKEALFVGCRETASVKKVVDVGVAPDKAFFLPDGTFAMHLRDDQAARAFMADHQLDSGKFACFVPRLRYTPYHKIHPERGESDETRKRDAVNAETAEMDHAKMRTAIVNFVRATGQKVAIVPEMTYELDIIDEFVYNPLPADVKAKVVPRRDYWLPDEAASLYAEATAVVSFECHSPIMALQAGTPAIYLRQPTDTIKGQMYRDIGVPDWIFEIDEATGEAIGQRVIAIAQDPAKAEAYRAAALAMADGIYDTSVQRLQAALVG